MTKFVLVHGAWHGGWCWRQVRKILEKHGHEVHTPTLTGVGERSHLMSRDITLETCITDICNVLRFRDLEGVVLVGHSFGGVLLAGVAEREPKRIQQLIFLDSDVLEDGESLFSVMNPKIVEMRTKMADETSNGVSMPPPDPSKLGVHDRQQHKFLKQHLTPHPLGTYISPIKLRHQPGANLPCTYVICTDPLYPAISEMQQRVVQRYGWSVREIATGHDLMITAPEETATLLMEITMT